MVCPQNETAVVKGLRVEKSGTEQLPHWGGGCSKLLASPPALYVRRHFSAVFVIERNMPCIRVGHRGLAPLTDRLRTETSTIRPKEALTRPQRSFFYLTYQYGRNYNHRIYSRDNPKGCYVFGHGAAERCKVGLALMFPTRLPSCLQYPATYDIGII